MMNAVNTLPSAVTDIDPWVAQVNDLRYVSREGDLVRIAAPSSSMAAPFNGCEGVLQSFAGGWVVVRLDGHGDIRFRPDELLTL